MSYKIFVDGREGTTGLQIMQRLSRFKDIELIEIENSLRKDPRKRAECLNEADLSFLCLPDAASKESVSLIENPSARVIDASTAFRCDEAWAYGFPEMERGQREKIRAANRVAVPGCYATGFTSLIHPLRLAGVMEADCPLSCNAVSGYTGGGKKLISRYENRPADDQALKCPRFYSFGLSHKHLPEMMKHNGLNIPPVFTPCVGDFPQGMLVLVPLQRSLLHGQPDAEALHGIFENHYQGEKFVRVMPFNDTGELDGGFLDPSKLSGTNLLEIFVYGCENRILLAARLDNLGKGASGAAIQCMNLMLGREESAGLLQ